MTTDLSRARAARFAAVLVFVCAQSAAAFDGSRQGFFLAVGLGLGQQSNDQEYVIADEPFAVDASGSGGGVDFSIGYGVTPRLVLSFDVLGSAITGKSLGNALADDLLDLDTGESDLAHGIGTLTVTWFQRDQAPSLFVSAGLGNSTFDDDSGAWELEGAGWLAGVGYEFRKNWSVELSAFYGNPTDDTQLASADVTATSVLLTVNHLWY